MGLGDRTARRHETEASRRTAGVTPQDYWAFKPGEPVLTCDGFTGRVTAVYDGLGGDADYDVVLDNNMGGGIYREGQLTSAQHATSSIDNTAAKDYPELAEILAQRPDPGRYPDSTLGMVASLDKTAAYYTEAELREAGQAEEQRQGRSAAEILSSEAAFENLSNEELGQQMQRLQGAGPNMEHSREELVQEIRSRGLSVSDLASTSSVGGKPGLGECGHLTWGGDCPSCGNAGDSNAMVVNDGDHRPQDVENTHNASLNEDTEDWHDEPDEDEDRFERTCPLCGNNAMEDGSHPYNGVGPDDVCPNSSEGRMLGTEHEMGKLDPSKYCDEFCQSNHAHDLTTGFADSAETAKHDAHDSCRNCGKPLEGTPGHQVDEIDVHPDAMRMLRSNPTGPTKYSALDNAYAVLADVASDPDFRFQVTAAWRDVRQKAQRIRSEGHVHITASQNGFIVAQVQGDHGTYESVLMRAPASQKVAQWDCGCTWAKYHWGAPDDTSRFSGRMCSHALALHFEAQSRGMFGREIGTDAGVPKWMTKHDFERTSSTEQTPMMAIAHRLIATGEDVEDVVLLITASTNSPFGEPSPTTPMPMPGPTAPRSTENPASAGFLTAADPESWSQGQIPGMDRQGSLQDDDALFEAEMQHTAGPALLLLPELAEGAAAAGAAGEAAGAAGAAGGAGGLLGGEAGGLAGAGEAAGSGMGRQMAEKGLSKGLTHHQNDDQGGQQQGSGKGIGFDDNAGYAADSANDLARRRQMAATLHDAPEPALPSTDGAAEDDDDQTYSGYAGDPDPDPRTASIPTGIGYDVPSDVSANSGGVGGSGGVGPGIGLKDVDDDSLSPEDTSIQTVGSVSDIVAEFQASVGASVLGGEGIASMASQQAANSEIAQAAKQFLETGNLPKTAMADFSHAEQQDLINEGGGVTRAANLDRLDIGGTHYEALEGALASIDDDEMWTA